MVRPASSQPMRTSKFRRSQSGIEPAQGADGEPDHLRVLAAEIACVPRMFSASREPDERADAPARRADAPFLAEGRARVMGRYPPGEADRAPSVQIGRWTGLCAPWCRLSTRARRRGAGWRQAGGCMCPVASLQEAHGDGDLHQELGRVQRGHGHGGPGWLVGRGNTSRTPRCRRPGPRGGSGVSSRSRRCRARCRRRPGPRFRRRFHPGAPGHRPTSRPPGAAPTATPPAYSGSGEPPRAQAGSSPPRGLAGPRTRRAPARRSRPSRAALPRETARNANVN
jgi:hypothetical protein